MSGFERKNGLVSVVTRDTRSFAGHRPEIMVRKVEFSEDLRALLAVATVVVIGPGLGTSDWGREIFSEALNVPHPLVVDADALNLLALSPTKRDSWVITPHPGEAATLLGGVDVQADRPAAVHALVAKYGGTAVLKGSGTLVGHGSALELCPYGNPGMSVAGMGDILSGVIGGLIAQGFELSAAAKLGVVVHSLAADYLVDRYGERGLLASEILTEIRRLLNP